MAYGLSKGMSGQGVADQNEGLINMEKAVGNALRAKLKKKMAASGKHSSPSDASANYAMKMKGGY